MVPFQAGRDLVPFLLPGFFCFFFACLSFFTVLLTFALSLFHWVFHKTPLSYSEMSGVGLAVWERGVQRETVSLARDKNNNNNNKATTITAESWCSIYMDWWNKRDDESMGRCDLVYWWIVLWSHRINSPHYTTGAALQAALDLPHFANFRQVCLP